MKIVYSIPLELTEKGNTKKNDRTAEKIQTQ